jgi:DNA-binding MarR family transcriptional regulator
MILHAIAESGSISHSELALRFAASIETFSRRLASARSAGWVQMRLADRGKRIYSLTPKGQKLLRDLTPEWERAQQRLKQSLGEEDWEYLAGFASRLTEAALRAELAQASNGRKC